MEELRKVGKRKTKQRALGREDIRLEKQQRIHDDFGTVDFDPEYDYNAERCRKRK